MNAARAFRFLLAASAAVLSGCATRQAADGKPQIYDPHADGERQLARALRQAERKDRRVLLCLGANWCGDSQAMHRLLDDDPALAAEARAHYVVVLVDVDNRVTPRRNAALVARLGEPLEKGMPTLLVLTPDGRVLNDTPDQRLDDEDHRFPDKVLAFLREYAGATP
ncbi:MAG: thioredoxin family protein [Limisphaerales bacterium]